MNKKVINNFAFVYKDVNLRINVEDVNFEFIFFYIILFTNDFPVSCFCKTTKKGSFTLFGSFTIKIVTYHKDDTSTRIMW